MQYENRKGDAIKRLTYWQQYVELLDMQPGDIIEYTK